MRPTSAPHTVSDPDMPPAPLDRPAPAGALDAPAARRNAAPLLSVLRAVLPTEGTVLEVGSGTGQHASAFAMALAPLRWLPTEVDEERRRSTALWAELVAENTRSLAARALDATAPPETWPITQADTLRAIVSVNVIHIAPWEVTQGLFAGAAHWLNTNDPLILYGPFHRHGEATGPGNMAFDVALRHDDPRWGIRDLDNEIEPLADTAGLRLDSVHPMPANNLTVVFRRL